MNDKHKTIKTCLKVFGIVFILIGVICFAVGLFGGLFGMVASSPEFDMNTPNLKLFFLTFIGIPFIFIGSVMTMFGFRKEVNTYVKNEDIPIAKEVYHDLKPEIKDFVDTIKSTDHEENIVCQKCGESNDFGSLFCKSCGKELKEKKCPHCNSIIDADSKFCSKCGKRI